jgi:hypothetical protein
MTGIALVMAGGAGGENLSMSVGSYFDPGPPETYYGFSNALGSGAPVSFGFMGPDTFKGLVIRGLYMVSFQTYFEVAGDQTAVPGFLNQILVDSVTLGTVPAPTYNGGLGITQWVFPGNLLSTGSPAIQLVTLR